MGKNKESSLESNDVSLVKLVVIQFYPLLIFNFLHVWTSHCRAIIALQIICDEKFKQRKINFTSN